MKFYSQNSTRRLGWAFRASSKLLFFSTRTSSSSLISARLATTSVQRSINFIIVAEGVDSGITGKLVWDFLVFFSPCWRFGRVAGILCLPLLTWHKHVGSRGGHRECACAFIRQKGSSCWNVTGPQQAAPGSEWLLCRPHTSASQRLHLQPYRLWIIFAQTSNWLQCDGCFD